MSEPISTEPIQPGDASFVDPDPTAIGPLEPAADEPAADEVDDHENPATQFAKAQAIEAQQAAESDNGTDEI
jgi:hypothetical protein